MQMEQAGDKLAGAIAEASKGIGEAVAHRHGLPRGQRRQEDTPHAQNQPVAQAVGYAGQQSAHGAQGHDYAVHQPVQHERHTIAHRDQEPEHRTVDQRCV